jgi:hypothetical protein
MHDTPNKMRTGLYIAGGLLTANIMDAVLHSQLFKKETFIENLQASAIADATIIPICSAYYLIKHM